MAVASTRLGRIIAGMSEDPRHLRGRAAEDMAAAHLRAHGLLVVRRNARCPFGEVDLVCRERDLLIIVEVRSRARSDHGDALESVTWRKQRRIVRTTEFLLQRHAEWRGLRVRFDVIAIEGTPLQSRRLRWVRDAFRPT